MTWRADSHGIFLRGRGVELEVSRLGRLIVFTVKSNGQERTVQATPAWARILCEWLDENCVE